MIYIILSAILPIQGFMAGYYFADKAGWQHTTGEKINLYVFTFAFLSVGFPLLLIGLILALIGGIHHRVWNYFHLTFLIKYIWLKMPLDYNPDGAKRINDNAKLMNPKWYQFNQRIYKYIDKWIQDKHVKNNS